MSKPRIVIIDTYYPEYLNSIVPPCEGIAWRYDELLRDTLSQSFGTADFYSRNLALHGWDAIDIIANYQMLQQRWAFENGHTHIHPEHTALVQIAHYKPDVVFMQDLSFFSAETLAGLAKRYVLAGQCSCPMPKIENIKKFHVLFTSFPHYVERFAELNVTAHYNPLAFEPVVLDRVTNRNPDRVYDCVFVGGVGTPSHWSYGMSVLESVAREIPQSKFWGYGYNLLSATSAVRAKSQGPAWGLKMYEILLSSKIVINRHGEVAGDYANNMKMFETTGCGALLLTDHKINIRDYFSGNEIATYWSPEDAVAKIKYLLERWDEGSFIARNGQARTLRDHTYGQRMQFISDVLKARL